MVFKNYYQIPGVNQDAGYSSKTVPPDSSGITESDIALEMLLRVAGMGKRCGRGMCRRQWR